MNYKLVFIVNSIMIREKKMKLPRFIQKWIRKQFNSKTLCDSCLEQYTVQTMTGAFLCDKCETATIRATTHHA